MKTTNLNAWVTSLMDSLSEIEGIDSLTDYDIEQIASMIEEALSK